MFLHLLLPRSSNGINSFNELTGRIPDIHNLSYSNCCRPAYHCCLWSEIDGKSCRDEAAATETEEKAGEENPLHFFPSPPVISLYLAKTTYPYKLLLTYRERENSASVTCFLKFLNFISHHFSLSLFSFHSFSLSCPLLIVNLGPL